MKVTIEQVKQGLNRLFPSPRSILNFFMMWLFLVVMSGNANPSNQIIVLVSGFAMLYFLNEWIKEIS